MTTSSARGAASQAARHPALQLGARLGYAANGLISLVIGWIALQLASGGGGGGEQASATGALQALAGQPFGGVLLGVVLVGFVLLGLWSVVQAFLGGEARDRAKHAGTGMTFLVLAGLTGTVLLGSTSGGGTGAQGITATAMQQPFGRLVVGLVGLGVVAVGGFHVVKGWTAKFREDLRANPPSWAVVSGRVGYVARGLAFVAVGGLVVTAAVTADPEDAQGLDGALQAFLRLPFGRVVLAAVALGFVAYGVYSFVRARHAKLD